MRTIRFKQPNSATEISYVPTSMKDLYWLFAAFGIPVNVIKWAGKYSLIYVNNTIPATQVNTPCRTIQDFTLKDWYEFSVKNMPVGYIQYDPAPLSSLEKTMINRVKKSIA